MVQLLRAGLIAGVRQIGAVVTMTFLMFLLATPNTASKISAPGAHSESFWISVSPFLAWAYIIVAVGLALTVGKSIGATAERIRHASHLMRPMTPERILVSLIVQCVLSATLFAILAVRTPPEPLITAARYFGWACAASIGWPAALSVAVACFGAIAHGALNAYRVDR